jgi:hypothetical protein
VVGFTLASSAKFSCRTFLGGVPSLPRSGGLLVSFERSNCFDLSLLGGSVPFKEDAV